MAVKLTLSPEHIETGFAAIETLAAKDEVTDIVMAFDVSCSPAAHAEDEVIMQVMVSPLFNVALA